MSTFTRTTPSAFWANPFQTFDTYAQARRAAKGASVLAWVFAALGAWLLGRFWLAGTAPQLARITILMTVPATLLTAGMGLLGWRIWVRPGPWKIAALLALIAWDIARAVSGFSTLNLLFVTTIAILVLALDVSVIAFRGALALKRLRNQIDLDVF
jgi:hypothetical protein